MQAPQVGKKSFAKRETNFVEEHLVELKRRPQSRMRGVPQWSRVTAPERPNTSGAVEESCPICALIIDIVQNCGPISQWQSQMVHNPISRRSGYSLSRSPEFIQGRFAPCLAGPSSHSTSVPIRVNEDVLDDLFDPMSGSRHRGCEDWR